MGIGTGVLAAIAFAASENLTDFVRYAPTFVVLALRLGLALYERASSIDPDKKGWSAVVGQASEEEVGRKLESFHGGDVSTSIAVEILI